ncbi:MAG: cytochrome C oxidase subunit II [Deltaproteobacteria bacterium]|nr:cytochrome C oxidase subunit II [Deltaproteobacteria bacterium]
MEKEKIIKGPKVVHPEIPSAIGSRNSLNRDGRNEYQESALLIDEEVDKLLNHISAKLPPEVLDKLDIGGNVKDKLHNYYNQNLQNMQNRYLVTIEDELLKKYHDLVDREETKQLNKYTPFNVAEILKHMGGDQFNTAAIEKSMVNIYKHLQGHMERGVQEFEHNTNALLRQKNDVGAFIRRENAYAIVKCSLKNNQNKPKTVFDVKLAINILDSELITPIYHYQKPLQQLLKEKVSDHIQTLIDKNIAEINNEKLNSGQTELKGDERLMEKLKAVENHLSFEDNLDDASSKQYDFIAKRFIDALESSDLESASEDIAGQEIRDNIERILKRENTKSLGFNRIVNALTTILDDSKMGYQHIDNLKNARVCVIREYAHRNKDDLPDETFDLRLSYFDSDQLDQMRKAYDLQFIELSNEIEKASKVVELIYQEFRNENDISDYQKISQEILEGGAKAKKKWWGSKEEEPAEAEDLLWDELAFIINKQNIDEVDKEKTNVSHSIILKHRIRLMKEKILKIYGTQYPEERLILEKRIEFLQEKFQEFSSMINPHHSQQGLILEVDITSVKRRRTTMHAMSDVLNEFLSQVSKGFSDQAAAGHESANMEVSDELSQKFTSVLKDMDKSLEEVEA